MKKTNTIVLAALLATTVALSPVPARAADSVPTEGATYTLTYPDGSTVTTTDYDEAMALQDEWKLLYSGKTDASGNITLEGWADSGKVKIVETKVPAGYTADSTVHVVDLGDGGVTVVNRRAAKLAATGDTGPWAAVMVAAAVVVLAVRRVFVRE